MGKASNKAAWAKAKVMSKASHREWRRMTGEGLVPVAMGKKAAASLWTALALGRCPDLAAKL
jgi:hypothetical protein